MLNLFKKLLPEKGTTNTDVGIHADIYILSYPKSGRTWLRAILGKYISLKWNLPEEEILSVTKLSVATGLPAIRFDHDGSAMLEKTHYQNLDLRKDKYAGKKVLLLGRDIKDTLVSAYFQATKRINVFDGSLAEFIRSDVYGAPKILTFYSGWMQGKQIPQSYKFVSYEDMHNDPFNTVSGILEYIGDEVDSYSLKASIDYCSFSNMQKLEKNNSFESSMLKAGDKSDPESFKVRKGKVGGYQEYLSEEDITYIENTASDYGFNFSKLEIV